MKYLIFLIGALCIPFFVISKKREIWIPAFIIYWICVVLIVFAIQR